VSWRARAPAPAPARRLVAVVARLLSVCRRRPFVSRACVDFSCVFFFASDGAAPTGLYYEDCLCESPVIDEALRRLPEEELVARDQRLKRAFDLSFKKIYLPAEEQTDLVNKNHYYLTDLRKEVRAKCLGARVCVWARSDRSAGRGGLCRARRVSQVNAHSRTRSSSD
jgi:ubiquinol-cytochrome c reductase subunit 7